MYYHKPYVIVTGLDPEKFEQTTMIFGGVDVREEEDDCYVIAGSEPVSVKDFNEAKAMVTRFLLADEKED